MMGKGEWDTLRGILQQEREEGRVLIAVVFGSYADGTPHARSELDLAVYLRAGDPEEEMTILDRSLMSTETDISILRLDDENESPFVVQEALKGTHLVEPDIETLYTVQHRVMHECESIRFRRDLRVGED